MRRAWIAGVLLLGLLVVGCGGSSEKKQGIILSEGEEWSVFESLLYEGGRGWTKQKAHQLRVLVESEGDSAREAQRCWGGRLLPGEWPRGCETYAVFEARAGIDKKGQAEINRDVDREEELERTCGPALRDRADLAEGPQGEIVPSQRLGCADIGRAWPLTVRQGLLQCEAIPAADFTVQRVTFTTPDGTVYAVNGSAKAIGYVPIDPIWRDDPELADYLSEGETLKVNIGPLIDRGLRLCEEFE